MTTFTCDWPIEGRACGRPAEWFLPVDNVHRPFCVFCVQLARDSRTPPMDGSLFQPISLIDPEKVPMKPLTQTERFEADRRETAERLAGRVQSTPDEDEPIPFRPTSHARLWQSIDEAGFEGEDESPARPSLGEAISELLVAALLGAKEGIDRWRRGNRGGSR